jgi:hypothetical protein
MTADIINLRSHKKQKARTEKEKVSEQKRLVFGLTKSEKKLAKARNEKAARDLDAGKRET